MTAQSSTLKQVWSSQTLSHSFHSHRRSKLNKITPIQRWQYWRKVKPAYNFVPCVLQKGWQSEIINIYMFSFSLHIYTIYTSGLDVQYIHTHICTVYIIIIIALNLKWITYTCFSEAFKNLNVLDIVDLSNSNTILLKIIIIIRFSNIMVNRIQWLRT